MLGPSLGEREPSGRAILVAADVWWSTKCLDSMVNPGIPPPTTS